MKVWVCEHGGDAHVTSDIEQACVLNARVLRNTANVIKFALAAHSFDVLQAFFESTVTLARVPTKGVLLWPIYMTVSEQIF